VSVFHTNIKASCGLVFATNHYQPLYYPMLVIRLLTTLTRPQGYYIPNIKQ
jgi:hypothetical protein